MSLETMKTRIDYAGGTAQVSRMNADKLRSLKKALLYSYQSATAILADGRKFKCLINPDKLKEDYENKIISIPFKDICLTTEEEEEIGMKAGDVFTWAENNTDWLVYLQRLEETAYFRAAIRRCQYAITIDDTTYKVYACGPSEEDVEWKKSSNIVWNNLNYTLEMYITKNTETLEYFHRFTKIKLNNLSWEVQAVDEMSIDGLIVVALKEDYTNTIEEAIEAEKETTTEDDKETATSYISGNATVYPYDNITYTVVGANGGNWSIEGTKATIKSSTDTTANVYINTGKSGSFVIKYSREGEDDLVLSVTIDSL